MKKLVIGVVIFAVISVLITGALIGIKNKGINVGELGTSSNVSGDRNENQEVNHDTSATNREKTLDLYGRYDENDLVIEEVVEKFELSNVSAELKIPQIKGLKNKSVEEKVNNDIKSRIIEKVNELSKQDNFGAVSSYTETSYNFGNFSNVISYTWHISYKLANESKSETIYLNYELLNGERLKFEDLFADDTDLHSIVRRMLYRVVASSTLENEGEGEVYYDEENDKWMRVDYWYDENGEEMTIEYIPSMTEDDISRIIQTFMNNEEKNFYFSPMKINIVIDGNPYSYYLYFKDIAVDVVIYDKYVTEESLYETSDIGMKNIWTCSMPTYATKYLEYGFAEDNLYYDVTIRNYYNIEGTEYPFKKSLNKLKGELIETANKKLEEYKKIAKENPDKFYILGISPHYYVEDRNFDIMMFTRINEYITSTDISYKEEVMNELLSSYRYHNLGFYNSALEYAGYTYDRTSNNEYYEGDIIFNSFEQKVEEKVYDARTLKEITTIDEIFKSDVDYMSIVKAKLEPEIRSIYSYISEEELNRLIEGISYTLTEYGIRSQVPGYDYYILMSYSDFDKSILKIYDLDMYIIPDSNTRNIEKSEIQNLTLDELNKAYNEIFARHGHDFKSKELKEYFELCSWYTPIANKSVSLEELNEIERYNLDIIKSLINEKKV